LSKKKKTYRNGIITHAAIREENSRQAKKTASTKILSRCAPGTFKK
jgi:hypothetical protein